MTLPATRIAKLLLLLASDQDGEVLAAARGIQRTLHAEGHDLHDLAAHLTTDHLRPQKHSPAPVCPRWRDLTPSERLYALYAIAAVPDLSAWEQQFVSTVSGLLRLRPHSELTQKQIRVLDRLLVRARQEPDA